MTTCRGEFWVPGHEKVAGTLEIRSDGTFVLSVEGYCLPPKQITHSEGSVSFTGDPKRIVEDFEPKTVYGELDGDHFVTLWDAHMEVDFASFPRVAQRFTGERRVLGAHIDGPFTAIEGIRWTWNTSIGLSGDAIAVEGPAGLLKPWSQGDRRGLEFIPDHPITVNELLKIQDFCNQLIGLWTGRWKVPDATLTQFLVNGSWCNYEVPENSGTNRIRSQLLELKNLSVEKFASWIPHATALYPIPHMVNASIPTIEVDAQIRTTSLEGLHGRLYDRDKSQRPFPCLSTRAIERAMKSARIAGIKALETEKFTNSSLANTRLQFALGHINEPTFEERAGRLVEDVMAIAPGLWGPDLQLWLTQVKNVRNIQSHLLLESRQGVDISRYFMVAVTARWTLTLRILIDVVEEKQLREALSRSQDFEFALANVDAEHPWSDVNYSALQTFRNSAGEGFT